MPEQDVIHEVIRLSAPGNGQGSEIARGLCAQAAQLLNERFSSSRGYQLLRLPGKDTCCEITLRKGSFCGSLKLALIYDIAVNPAGGTERHPHLEFTARCGNRKTENLERACRWLTSGSTIVGLATITPLIILPGLAICLFILLYLSTIGAAVIGTLVIILGIFVGGSLGEVMGRLIAGGLRLLFGGGEAATSRTNPEFQRCCREWQEMIRELRAALVRAGDPAQQAV